MKLLIFFLIILVPFLTILYYCGEQFKWWDKLTGRDKAIQGLERLEAVTGFPQGWIYNEGKDKEIFRALERRISKKTASDKILLVLKEGHKPSLIVVGGLPMSVSGVPPEWPQEARTYYASNHPVMYGFGITIKQGKGKMEKVCTIGELSEWIEEEKVNWRFLLLNICLGVLSIILISLKYYIDISQKK
jgi:hypothetical protein